MDRDAPDRHAVLARRRDVELGTVAQIDVVDDRVVGVVQLHHPRVVLIGAEKIRLMREVPPRAARRTGEALILAASGTVGERDHRVAATIDRSGTDEADILRATTAAAVDRDPVLAPAAAHVERSAGARRTAG